MGFSIGLAGPVEVALAKSAEKLPRPTAMAGGACYELKWDGYRCAAVATGGRVRLWSRQGTDLTDRFPDVRTAMTDQLATDCVLDGELVVWGGDRLDFDALQARMSAKVAHLPAVASERPASYVAFDVLAIEDHDLRANPLHDRRSHLEALAVDWSPPLQLSPMTTALEEAEEWMTAYYPAGIEGIVAKAGKGRYRSGQRDW